MSSKMAPYEFGYSWDGRWNLISLKGEMSMLLCTSNNNKGTMKGIAFRPHWQYLQWPRFLKFCLSDIQLPIAKWVQKRSWHESECRKNPEKPIGNYRTISVIAEAYALQPRSGRGYRIGRSTITLRIGGRKVYPLWRAFASLPSLVSNKVGFRKKPR